MPSEQVLGHRLGGDVDQVVAIVIRLDLHAGQHAAGCSGLFSSSTLALTAFDGGDGLVAACKQHDALDLVVLVAPRPVCRWIFVDPGDLHAGGLLRLTRPSRV